MLLSIQRTNWSHFSALVAQAKHKDRWQQSVEVNNTVVLAYRSYALTTEFQHNRKYSLKAYCFVCKYRLNSQQPPLIATYQSQQAAGKWLGPVHLPAKYQKKVPFYTLWVKATMLIKPKARYTLPWLGIQRARPEVARCVWNSILFSESCLKSLWLWKKVPVLRQGYFWLEPMDFNGSCFSCILIRKWL